MPGLAPGRQSPFPLGDGHRQLVDQVPLAGTLSDADSMSGKLSVAAPGLKILVAGDSGASQLAGSRDPLGFWDLLLLFGIRPAPTGLAALGYEVLNEAIPGSGCAREDIFGPALTWADSNRLTTKITALSPTKVVISFAGNNNVWSDATKTAPEPHMTLRWQQLSVAGFQDVLADARAALTDTNIIVVAGWRVGGGTYGWEWANALNWFGAHLLSTVLPATPNVLVVDVSDISPYDTALRTPDQAHLTNAGAELVARRIAAKLGAGTAVEPTLPGTLPPPARPDASLPSERFRITVAESHEEVTRVDVLVQDLPDPIMIPVEEQLRPMSLGVIDGKITMDAGDVTRRSADLEVWDPDGHLTPDLAEDILGPLTAEVRIWKGPRYPEGTTELKSCGVFKVKRYELLNRGDKRTFRLTCFDRSIRAQKPFGRPWVVVAGVPLENAIRDMIRHKAPTLPMRLAATGLTAPALLFPGSANPWEEASKMARWAGYKLEVDRDGVLTMANIVVNVGATAVWGFKEDPRSMMWEVERSLEEAPNHVIIRGTGTNSTAFGEAKDLDPASRTYVGGRYGDVLLEESDERITSNAMATRAAVGRLGQELGGSERIPAKALVNSAMNLDETGFVEREQLGLSTFALIDRIELPLTSGPGKYMPVVLRRGVRTDTALVEALAS